MTEPKWLLYGANGYTGQLIIEEALSRGHRPILAGRSQEKLAPLAEHYGLEMVCVGLEDPGLLAQAIQGFGLVLHAAGPFSRTSDPMLRACLAAGCHYLDITGEIPVFENTFKYDQEARQRGLALISGVGFDVVPTDCMSAYIAKKVPEARELEIAVNSIGQSSPGTAKTMLEGLPNGGLVRRDGKLVPYPLGQGARWIRFAHKERLALPIPWGDLSTAYRTTGIPNITTYFAYPPGMIRWMRLGIPLVRRLLKITSVRSYLERQVELRVQGPGSEARQSDRSHVWVRAANQQAEAQAWLDTLEGYQFTAAASVRSVEKVLANRPAGALTPAQAFGADFVLEIEGTQRYDRLPEG